MERLAEEAFMSSKKKQEIHQDVPKNPHKNWRTFLVSRDHSMKMKV